MHVQVLESWNALIDKEEKYRFFPAHTPPSLTGANSNNDYTIQNFTFCPSEWRAKICEWCYQVIDLCNIDRSIVGIALYYFDRYCALKPTNEASYQLVAMTSLWLAVKVHSPRKIPVDHMVSLSRGFDLSIDQVLQMETFIIKNNNWFLHPPTSSIFLSILEPLIDNLLANNDLSSKVKDRAMYLIELSVCDSYFIPMKPSCVTLGAVLTAIQTLKVSPSIQHKVSGFVLNKLPQMTTLCAKRHLKVYEFATSQLAVEKDMTRTDRQSPTSVLQG